MERSEVAPVLSCHFHVVTLVVITNDLVEHRNLVELVISCVMSTFTNMMIVQN